MFDIVITKLCLEEFLLWLEEYCVQPVCPRGFPSQLTPGSPSLLINFPKINILKQLFPKQISRKLRNAKTKIRKAKKCKAKKCKDKKCKANKCNS